jgi:hypothetical protein
MRKFIFSTLLILLAILANSIYVFAQNPQTDLHLQRKKARREQGIYAAAKITGNYVYSGDGMTCNIFDLPEIARESNLIVIGSAIDNVCKLRGPADDESIVTEYKIQIEEVIKGHANIAGKVVEVITPGGKITFPDGVSAEETSSTRKMRNGSRYILFLSESSQGKKLLFPFAMTSGVFEITDEGKIIFCGRTPALTQLTEPNLTRQTGRGVEEFLQEVRSLVTN